jgi:hypothetical protein
MMTRQRLCIAAALAGLLVCNPAAAQLVTQNFDADPGGWTGFGNTIAPNSFGFSNSNNAGGTAGEMGGSIASRSNDTWYYYADTNLPGGGFNQQQLLTISGRFVTPSFPSSFDGGFEIGFFDHLNPVRIDSGPGVGGIADELGMRILDNNGVDGQFRIHARWGALETNDALTLSAGTQYLFNILYDPNGGGPNVGVETVNIGLAADSSFVGSLVASGPSDGTPFALNAFGIVTLNFSSDNPEATFFFDNLNYGLALAGDLNSDGQVNLTDYGILKSNWFQNVGNGISDGDLNFDGTVNLTDFALFRQAYQDFNGGGGGAFSAVPEPATILLVIASLPAWCMMLRRKGRSN